MHASVKTFMETNFVAYLHLGELDLEGLHQLYSDPDVEEDQPKGSSSNIEPSSNPLGK